jgi:hypothetical protein
MPARKLEVFVNKGIKAGGGAMIEPSTLAETLFTVASRGEKVPLRLPLGVTCYTLAKMKFSGALAELEAIKEISAMGQPI